MRIFFIAFCSIWFFFNAHGQIKKEHAKRFFFHSHGISFQTFENINERIAAYPQLQALKNTTGTLQFGTFAERGKVVTSFSANAGSSLGGNPEKKSSAVSFMGLSADIGYNFLKSSRLSFYPFAGLGYENFKAKFNRDVSSVPFDSLLQNSSFQQRTENLVLNNSFLAYRLGLGLFFTSKKRLRNSIGFQVVYTGGFGREEWKVNRTQTLQNSPSDKLSKLMASVFIRYQTGKNQTN